MKLFSRRAMTGLLAVLLMALQAPAAGARTAVLKVGDTPPDVFSKDAKGDAVHLGDYRGKVVIISFWASWCPPCRKELPVLLEVQKQATRRQLVVVSVNRDQDFSQFIRIKQILKDRDITLVRDSSDRAARAYGVDGIPHMLIVGRDGRIKAIHIGYGEGEIPMLVNEINAELLADHTAPDTAAGAAAATAAGAGTGAAAATAGATPGAAGASPDSAPATAAAPAAASSGN